MSNSNTYNERLRKVVEHLRKARDEGVSNRVYSEQLGYASNWLAKRGRVMRDAFDAELHDAELFEEFEELMPPPGAANYNPHANAEASNDIHAKGKAWQTFDGDGRIERYKGFVSHLGRRYDFEFSRDQVERMYGLYTGKGSGTKRFVHRRMGQGFPKAAFDKIIYLLGLRKDAYVPPHIEQEKSPDEIAEWQLNNRTSAAEEIGTLKARNHYEKALFKREKELAEVAGWKAQILDVLEDAVGEMQVIEVPQKAEYEATGHSVVSLFGDVHFGKVFGRGRSMDAAVTDKDTLRRRILDVGDRTVAYAVRRKSKSVVLCVLGDLFESLLPNGMHPGQNDNMDLRGSAQFTWALRVMHEMLTRMRHALPDDVPLKLKAIGGNHDRSADKRSMDYGRSAAMALFESLGYVLECTPIVDTEVYYHPEQVYSFVEDDVNYIIYHGDNGLVKRGGAEMVVNFGQPAGYTIIAHGHYHKSKMEDSGRGFMKIAVPSVCGNDEYSQNQLGYVTTPGFVIGERCGRYWRKTLEPLT